MILSNIYKKENDMEECGGAGEFIQNMEFREGDIRNAFSEAWLEDAEIEMDLRELVNMFGRDQVGCQDRRCACGQVNEFARGEEIAKSLRNGRIVMRSGVDIAEIRRMAESDRRRRREGDGIPVRIIDGWNGANLTKVAKQDNPIEEYDRGWLLPNARWAGISTDCAGQMRCGDDVVEGEDVDLAFQKFERSRNSKNGKPPTEQEIPQHQRAKWGSSGDMEAIQGESIPLLTEGELDCLGEDIACKDYKRAPAQLVWMWMFQKKKLTEDANRSSLRGKCRR